MTASTPEVGGIFRTAETLPTLPGVVRRLTLMADTGTATTEEMARVVNTDQVLAGKVLKLVNSALFGFSGRIATVSGAIILLGVNVVKSLAVSSAVFEIMEKHVLGLWTHSMGVAAAANVLATRLRLPDVEEIATAGLLHDIGKVVVKLTYPKETDRLDGLAESRGITMVEAERQHLGVDHAEIGGRVARHWRLPDRLVEPIAFHHDVAHSIAHRQRTAVIHVADILIRGSAFDGTVQTTVPTLDPAGWESLDLNEALLEAVIEEMEERLVDVTSFSLEMQSGHGRS